MGKPSPPKKLPSRSHRSPGDDSNVSASPLTHRSPGDKSNRATVQVRVDSADRAASKEPSSPAGGFARNARDR